LGVAHSARLHNGSAAERPAVPTPHKATSRFAGPLQPRVRRLIWRPPLSNQVSSATARCRTTRRRARFSSWFPRPFRSAENIRLKNAVFAVPNEQHHGTFANCTIIASLCFLASSVRQPSYILFRWIGDDLSFGQVAFDDGEFVGVFIPGAFNRRPIPVDLS